MSTDSDDVNFHVSDIADSAFYICAQFQCEPFSAIESEHRNIWRWHVLKSGMSINKYGQNHIVRLPS